jgi:hypothetical protein
VSLGGVQLDPNTLRGQLDGSANLPRNKHSNGYAASIIANTGPGILYGFTAYNSNGSAQFIQLFDSATVPADGVQPATLFTIAAGDQLAVEWINGRSYLAGVVLCNSSTGPTKTIGAADCYFDVQYI